MNNFDKEAEFEKLLEEPDLKAIFEDLTEDQIQEIRIEAIKKLEKRADPRTILVLADLYELENDDEVREELGNVLRGFRKMEMEMQGIRLSDKAGGGGGLLRSLQRLLTISLVILLGLSAFLFFSNQQEDKEEVAGASAAGRTALLDQLDGDLKAMNEAATIFAREFDNDESTESCSVYRGLNEGETQLVMPRPLEEIASAAEISDLSAYGDVVTAFGTGTSYAAHVAYLTDTVRVQWNTTCEGLPPNFNVRIGIDAQLQVILGDSTGSLAQTLAVLREGPVKPTPATQAPVVITPTTPEATTPTTTATATLVPVNYAVHIPAVEAIALNNLDEIDTVTRNWGFVQGGTAPTCRTPPTLSATYTLPDDQKLDEDLNAAVEFANTGLRLAGESFALFAVNCDGGLASLSPVVEEGLRLLDEAKANFTSALEKINAVKERTGTP